MSSKKHPNKRLKGLNKNSKKEKLKTSKCINANPQKSRWGDWAPAGGCTNKVYVSEGASGRLCSECTQRVVTQSKNR
jgi:hypothetical protein